MANHRTCTRRLSLFEVSLEPHYVVGDRAVLVAFRRRLIPAPYDDHVLFDLDVMTHVGRPSPIALRAMSCRARTFSIAKRSEARRDGKEGVHTVRYRRQPYN